MSESKGPVNCDVTQEQLKTLMESRGEECYRKITNNFGDLDNLCKTLGTSSSEGLKDDPEDLQQRKALFGTNTIPRRGTKSFLRLLLDALLDVTLIILCVAAIVSLGVSFYNFDSEEVGGEDVIEMLDEVDYEEDLDWIEGTAILLTVFVVMFVTAINNWTKERQFRALQNRIEEEHKISVIRSGTSKMVLISELVVGDICQIKYGDILPADGILVQNNDLKVDESSLTGESDLVKKGEQYLDVSLLSGTNVMEGSGRMLVTAVGLNSQTGIIMSLLGATKAHDKPKEKSKLKEVKSKGKKKDKGIVLNKCFKKLYLLSLLYRIEEKGEDEKKSKDSNSSVLQTKLEKLAIQIGYAGTSMAVITVLILIIRFCVVKFIYEQRAWEVRYVQYIIQSIIIGITVVVVAVPEGLPLAVTIGLAYAVRKMTRDNNLVRHLNACETMGNATTICSDKTGTLTTNRMTVVQSYICDNHHSDRTPNYDDLPEPVAKLLVDSISVNCSYTSYVTVRSNKNNHGGRKLIDF